MKDNISLNAIPQRISCLRDVMHQRGISACIIPTGDPHMSEYVSDHDKSRAFITGFTGSAGTAVITDSDAGLWADSRYWLQAADQLEGSGIRLFRDGAPETPSIGSWLCHVLPAGGTVCVCGTAISHAEALRLEKALAGKGLVLDTGLDLIDLIWEDRPPLQHQAVIDYPLCYAGVSRTEKISLVRGDLHRSGADALVLPMLDDIAWLLNLRGSDIPCSPVFFSYVILTAQELRLYAFPSCFSEPLMQKLAEDGVTLLPYEQFYEDLGELGAGTVLPGTWNAPPDDVAGKPDAVTVMLDPQQCNALIYGTLSGSVKLLERPCPVMRRKCVKNSVEMGGIRAAHIQDGIAMCRFLHWLKRNMDAATGAAGVAGAARAAEAAGAAEAKLTELSVAQKLLEFRSQGDLFTDISFETIAAYGPHAAIVHYTASEESDAALEPCGLLLVDSGGQYLNGTTDITRTIALGPLTDDEKKLFTTVLRGHIALAKVVFPRGLTGANLDILAHQPLWQMGLDYGHGTGHGVGAFLHVHEDPVRIHWKSGRTRDAAEDSGSMPSAYTTSTLPIFTEGMLTSDEPGYYETGQFGIRHENLLLCVSADGNCVGQDSNDFLRFETVTLVPFDLDAILPEMMQPEEIEWLNAYHERVFQTIGPHLQEEERKWLREATRPIR